MTYDPGGGAAGADFPWEGKLHVAWADGNPFRHGLLWGFQNSAVSVAGPTPTGIGTAVGRLVYFRFRKAITVNRIRYFCVGTVATAYAMAIYRESDGARIWIADPAATVAATWQSILTGLPITLAADTGYWLGLSAKTTGTTAGFRTPASPVASSIGVLTMPGNLNAYGLARFAQVPLVAGAWPTTLPALAAAAFASGGTTGSLPVVFLDNSAT